MPAGRADGRHPIKHCCGNLSGSVCCDILRGGRSTGLPVIELGVIHLMQALPCTIL